MKILLVDDSKTMRVIWKKVLESIGGGQTVEGTDGVEGLDAFENQGPFDLILTDWNMPNMNGLEMVTRIRAKDKVTPIIMVTTEAQKPRIIKAIKAGVSNYVVKPFTPDKLIQKIDETLKKAAAT